MSRILLVFIALVLASAAFAAEAPRGAYREFRDEEVVVQGTYAVYDTEWDGTPTLVGPIGSTAPVVYPFVAMIGVKRVDLVVLSLNPGTLRRSPSVVSFCPHRARIGSDHRLIAGGRPFCTEVDSTPGGREPCPSSSASRPLTSPPPPSCPTARSTRNSS